MVRLEPRLSATVDRATLAADSVEAQTSLEAARVEQTRAERLLAERAVPARRVEDARRATVIAEARAKAKVADKTWVNAHAARTMNGTICVRVQRFMSPASAVTRAPIPIVEPSTAERTGTASSRRPAVNAIRIPVVAEMGSAAAARWPLLAR